MRWAFIFALALCACEARINANGGGVDASNGGGDDGSTPDDAAMVGTDAPACFNGRVVFLNFEGQALTKGASDAKTNHASWMQINSGTAPKYHAGSANRTAEIQAIVDAITLQLSSFPITVVTTRPTTGDYMMIVYGGTPNQVGSRFNGAVQQLDCGDATARNDVAWVADNVSPTQKIANFSIGSIGFGLGLTATLVPTDCMCGWDNTCISDNSAACTLTPGIARDPNANQKCPGVTTQDEVATFAAGFCQ